MHTKHDSDTLHAVHRYLIGENRITWLLDWQLETGLCRVTREGKRGGGFQQSTADYTQGITEQEEKRREE